MSAIGRNVLDDGVGVISSNKVSNSYEPFVKVPTAAIPNKRNAPQSRSVSYFMIMMVIASAHLDHHSTRTATAVANAGGSVLRVVLL